MHEFSELLLARTALHINQSRSVLAFRFAKAQFAQVVSGKKYVSALDFDQNQFFSAGKNGQWKTILVRGSVWVYNREIVTKNKDVFGIKEAVLWLFYTKLQCCIPNYFISFLLKVY